MSIRFRWYLCVLLNTQMPYLVRIGSLPMNISYIFCTFQSGLWNFKTNWLRVKWACWAGWHAGCMANLYRLHKLLSGAWENRTSIQHYHILRPLQVKNSHWNVFINNIRFWTILFRICILILAKFCHFNGLSPKNYVDLLKKHTKFRKSNEENLAYGTAGVRVSVSVYGIQQKRRENIL